MAGCLLRRGPKDPGGGGVGVGSRLQCLVGGPGAGDDGSLEPKKHGLGDAAVPHPGSPAEATGVARSP